MSRAALHLAASAVAAALLAGCGGSQGGSVLAPAQAVSPALAGTGAVADVELRLEVPNRTGPADYVSRSTRSIVVKEGKVELQAFNVRVKSKSCAIRRGATLCTFHLGLIPGYHTFVIGTYDRFGGKGNLLSQARITKKIQRGFNVLPVTLNGVVASIVLALASPNPPAGVAASLPITVMAEDADANVILGAGRFKNAITLSTNDNSGTLTLPVTRVSGPLQTVSASYNGASILSASIGATSAGIEPQNITAATFAPAMNPIGDFEVIHQTTKPYEQPTAITTGADGNIWAAVSTANYGIVRMTTSGTMTLFQSGVAPGTNLPQVVITGMARGNDGNVWYADAGSVGTITPAGLVTDYPLAGGALCAGAVANRIVAAAPADGGMWVSIACTTDSQIAHVTQNGTQAFFNVTGLSGAQGLVVGKDANVYIAGTTTAYGDASVAQGIVSGSTIASVSVLDIGALTSVSLVGLAQSADGDLWATTGACTPSALVRLHLAAAFSATNASVFPTLAGCASPYFLTATPDNALWVPNEMHPTATRVVPGVYPAAPVQEDVTLPTPSSIPGNEVDATLGPDGNIYFADKSIGVPEFAGDIAKLAY